MKSAGKARNNGLYRHIRTSKEIIRNLLNDFLKILIPLSSIKYNNILEPASIRSIIVIPLFQDSLNLSN